MCSKGFVAILLRCVRTVFVCGFAVISGVLGTRDLRPDNRIRVARKLEIIVLWDLSLQLNESRRRGQSLDSSKCSWNLVK